jgi:glutathione S-transferase
LKAAASAPLEGDQSRCYAARMPEIIVHHLENSRSHRVLWLLEELGLPYRIERYARDPETMRAPAELEAIHPLGKSPVVTIDGEVFAESGAILEHLVDVFGEGKLRPAPGTDASRRYRFFLHYAEGSFMPPLLVKLITGVVRKAKVPFFVKPIANAIVSKIDEGFADPEIKRHLRFLESELEGRTFLTGEELTAADIQMSYPLAAAATRGGLGRGYPKLTRYLERLREQPAYARAVERGGEPIPPGV